MRQAIITLCLFGSFIVFALTVNLFDTLVMFILFGILPNDTTRVSPDQMLLIHGGSALVITLYALRRSVRTGAKLVVRAFARKTAQTA